MNACSIAVTSVWCANHVPCAELHEVLTWYRCHLVGAVLYPLDTIKTRLQTATSEKSIRALWKAGGNKALYSGLMGNLAGANMSLHSLTPE